MRWQDCDQPLRFWLHGPKRWRIQLPLDGIPSRRLSGIKRWVAQTPKVFFKARNAAKSVFETLERRREVRNAISLFFFF